MKQYDVEFTNTFNKEFRKLDRVVQKRIYSWIQNNLQQTTNPFWPAKQMRSPDKMLVRYRIGKYRVIAEIQEKKLLILCLNVNARGQIYNGY